MPSKSKVRPLSWGAAISARTAAIAAAQPVAVPSKEDTIVTTVSAPALTGLAALHRANAILSAIQAGEQLSTAPGELEAVRASIAALIAQAQLPAAPAPVREHKSTCDFFGSAAFDACACAAPAPRALTSKGVARVVQPVAVVSAAGKALRKLWHVEVFGPYLLGEATSGGWTVRDTRSNEDIQDGWFKADGRVLARAYAAERAAEFEADEAAALAAVAGARVVLDGKTRVAR